jgi:hypothetical protein
MPITTVTNFDYLIEPLRLHLGDIDSTKYRYTDEWLRTTLFIAIKTSMKWLKYRYNVDSTTYVLTRSSSVQFTYTDPPIIQDTDERVVILLAGIILKQGQLENSAWDIASWKDAEISYSNLESGKQRESSIKRDWEELAMIVQIPMKKLAKAAKGDLPGYLGNISERGSLY